MKKVKDLPTHEMRDDMPLLHGDCTEEVAPNSLNDKRISQLAYESVFMYQPEPYACYDSNLKTL